MKTTRNNCSATKVACANRDGKNALRVALEAAEFVRIVSESGAVRYERGMVRVCVSLDDGTHVYVFAGKIGYTLAGEAYFAGAIPVSVIVAAATAMVAS